MNHRHLPSRQAGIVLIVVVLILSILAAIVFEFCYDSRMNVHLADNARRASQALCYAEAGLAIASAMLEQKTDLWTEEESRSILSGTVQVPLGEGYCTMSIERERSKINVNGLVDGKGKPVRRRVDQMLRLIDLLNQQRGDRDPIGYGLVAAMIDWIDADDDVTVVSSAQGENSGAEDAYYQSLEKPYRCGNNPLEILGELLLVKGMTEEIFYGTTDTGRANPGDGMASFLTIYGDGRFNINDASVILLQTLSERIDRSLAEEIVRLQPYGSLDELNKVPGMTPEALKAIREAMSERAGDEYFIVTARGVVDTAVRTVRIVLLKSRARGRLTRLMRWEL